MTRGWIGVQVQPVTADIAESLGIKQAQGAIVDAAQPGGPAAKAGIKAGDVITAMNGTPIKDSRDLARRVGATAPGTSVKFDVFRDGQSQSVSVTLGQLQAERQANADTGQHAAPTNGEPRLGVELAPASDVDGAGDEGVVVMGVEPSGPAATHGLRTGDLILSVSGKQVSRPEDVRNALAAAHKAGRRSILMQVKTADAAPHFVAVPLG